LTRRRALGLLGLSAGAVATSRAGLLAQQAPSPGKVTFPPGAIIRTILKDLPPEALGNGYTLFHEHLSLNMGPAPQLPPGVLPPSSRGGQVDRMVEEIRAVRKDGVTMIVDAGHADQGRSLDELRQLATRTDLHIVACGGYHSQRTYPPDMGGRSEDALVEEFVRDAQAQRWGGLGEIGSSNKMTPDETKVFRAIGRAQVRTNLKVFTHTPYHGGTCEDGPGGYCAVRQLDILESVGVSPRNVCIGHVGDIRNDPKAETHKAIAKRGAFIGFDSSTLEGERWGYDTERVGMIMAFLDAGYIDQLLLSSDYNGDEKLFGIPPAGEMRSVSGRPPGYGRTLTVFVPMLKKAGVTDAMLQRILVDNPRRFIAFVPKTA
jgi:phosphotriesterase-related protein